VHDNINGKDIVLSDEDWALVKNILRQKFPDNYDPYEDFYETPYADADFPVTNRPLSKAAYTPSIWEDKKVCEVNLKANILGASLDTFVEEWLDYHQRS
jgi:hypothetical protein